MSARRVLRVDVVGAAIVALSMACGAPHRPGPSATPSPSPTPAPVATPTPTPAPVATPTPTPSPELGACAIPVDDPHAWQFLGTGLDSPAMLRAVVLGAAPRELTCPAEPDALLDALAAELRAIGVCAGVPVSAEGTRADAVFARRGLSDEWEEYHAVSYASRCWSSRDWYVGAWRYVGGAP